MTDPTRSRNQDVGLPSERVKRQTCRSPGGRGCPEGTPSDGLLSLGVEPEIAAAVKLPSTVEPKPIPSVQT